MMSLSVFDGPRDRGLLDRLELRVALVGHVGGLHQLLVDTRGLWNLRQQHRFGGLIGARHGREHARPLVRQRDLLEVVGQVRRCERPRPVEIGCAEPAAGNQVVHRTLRAAQPEDVALGVADPDQPGAGHRQVIRRPLEQNQFRRRRADEHLRRLGGRQRPAGQRCLDVLPVLVGRQLCKAQSAACLQASRVP